MPLWAGCEEYLVKALQVIQNKAARSVTKLSIFTPTKVLLKNCGWMSVKQLMVYHSIVLLNKTLANQSPEHMYKKATAGGQFSYKTRQAAVSFSVQHPTNNGTIRQAGGHKLGMSKNGWCWRSVEIYNTLPTDLRLERKLPKFKTRLKKWVEENVNI